MPAAGGVRHAVAAGSGRRVAVHVRAMCRWESLRRWDVGLSAPGPYFPPVSLNRTISAIVRLSRRSSESETIASPTRP
ncbi:hypothetical protein GA0115254_116071 [Streptomyces sp. Ncost-T10-10d]|nr:hypothetical protein GA0115254_116071 [Streptomyces sp. Ncost-T10-10d]